MNNRWTIGAVIAVLLAMLVLPGIASADHHADVNANTACDGTFVIDADFHSSTISSFSSEAYISYNGHNYDDGLDENVTDPAIDAGDIPADMTATPDSHYVVVGGGDDYFGFGPDEDASDFFTLSGTYDSVVNAGGSVTVDAEVTNGGIGDSATVASNSDWEDCRIGFCQAGDSNGGNDYSFKASPDNNCDPERVCADGESLTVSEFDADALLADGATKGSCTPSEDPPVITTTSLQPQPQTVAQEETVAEVSPAVEEVAALPSAGYGTTSDASNTWAALLSLALLGLGGTTLLIARSRK